MAEFLQIGNGIVAPLLMRQLRKRKKEPTEWSRR